mmetsp:Transcript_17555/g.32493  ORF Transcript_17555/g.32493 Transcript_17555/m.32493 type:complete len:216 (-) Transcript_17555:6-653(-)
MHTASMAYLIGLAFFKKATNHDGGYCSSFGTPLGEITPTPRSTTITGMPTVKAISLFGVQDPMANPRDDPAKVIKQNAAVNSSHLIRNPLHAFKVVVNRVANAKSSGISASDFVRRYSNTVYWLRCRSRNTTGNSFPNKSMVAMTVRKVMLITPKDKSAVRSAMVFTEYGACLDTDEKTSVKKYAQPTETNNRTTLTLVFRIFCRHDRSNRAHIH